MPAMRLYGIAIDEVRDIFGAPTEVAERLRSAYTAAYPSKSHRRGWGLFRRNPGTQVDPTRPTAADVEAMLTGGFVAADRVGPCWDLLALWLSELSTHVLTVSYSRLEPIEFDLARRGLPSTHSLARLAERNLGIPLRPRSGLRTGYCHHRHAIATGEALAAIDPETLENETANLIAPLIAYLKQLPHAVDVVVIDED